MSARCLTSPNSDCPNPARCADLGCTGRVPHGEQYGPARYRIYYRSGHVSYWGLTMEEVLRVLRRRARYAVARPPLRVEPVEGTQYRATYNGAAGAWHAHQGDDARMRAYVAAVAPLSRLELRSPVPS